MDKLSKLLTKLTQKERSHTIEIISALISGEISSLDIKKLKGVDSIYRVRVGNLRIIYRKNKSDIHILEISRRNEGTYKKY